MCLNKIQDLNLKCDSLYTYLLWFNLVPRTLKTLKFLVRLGMVSIETRFKSWKNNVFPILESCMKPVYYITVPAEACFMQLRPCIILIQLLESFRHSLLRSQQECVSKRLFWRTSFVGKKLLP